MNAKEIAKLRTIIGKLEALQNQVSNSGVADQLGTAKNELLRVLSRART